MEAVEVSEYYFKIAETFRPSAPVDTQALFAGRVAQLQSVLNAVHQLGQHVILYGERGVGKTSLATVVSNIMKGRQRVVATLNCDASLTFAQLWKKVFREIGVFSHKPSAGFVRQVDKSFASFGDQITEGSGPDDIRHLLMRLPDAIIVIDEFDRLIDPDITVLMADTIKTLSDHAVKTTLILVGVADSVENLIEQHQSIERALVQIRMPRMSAQELQDIVKNGASKTGFTASKEVCSRIANLSQGLPHYAHLLSLHAFQHAIQNSRLDVQLVDVDAAIEKALSETQQSVIRAYHDATSSSRTNLYPQVLLACALAKVDILGTFSASDVRESLSRIMQKPYEIPAFSQHLTSFCGADRGPILQKIGTRHRFRFRFCNPLMQPYVVMHGIRNGAVPEKDIESFRN